MHVVRSSVIRNSFRSYATQCVWVIGLSLCDVSYQSAHVDGQSSVKSDVLEKKHGRRCHSCAGNSILDKLKVALFKTFAFALWNEDSE